jgi:hypothetical protein
MTDMSTVILQNYMDLEKDVPGSCCETCPTYPHDADSVISIKVENVSDMVDEEDPVPVGFLGIIKAKRQVSCIEVVG